VAEPKKSKRKPSKKKSIEARRKQVSVLLKQGSSQTEIAEILGVSRSTVINDIARIHNKSALSVKEVVDRPAEMVAESLRVWEEIIESASEGFTNSPNPAQKNAFLRTKGQANNERLKALMELGILPRASLKQDLSLHVIDGVDMSKASLEELSSLARTLAARAASQGIDTGPLLPDSG